MDRQTQQKLFKEIKSYIASGTTKLAAAELAHPARVYYDSDHHARERKVLARYPQVAGHRDDLPEAGDYITHDLLGEPIIIARQKDGSLAAFSNVCSHRGARVCDQAKGQASQFMCPYHAWTYGLDGSLRGIPRSGFPNLDKAAASLPRLQVEERHGLIWVLADRDGSTDIARQLDKLDAELASYGMADCVLHHSEVLEADINWKCVLDGFLEIYHFASLHAGSIAPYFYGTHSPYDEFGLNGRLVGVRKAFDAIMDKPFEKVDFLSAVAVNYLIFPNTFIIWQGDHFETWTAFPGERPDKCRVLIQMMIPRAIYTETSIPRWKRNWQIMIDTVVKEDWAMSRDVQSALPHIAGGTIYLGANEPGLQHFHANMLKKVGTVN